MNDKKTIAIIEDDDSIRQMYEYKLISAGYNVLTASDGSAGYKLIIKNKPDLVLLDLKLPKMSGDEVLEKLRNTDVGERIKVIIITNMSKDEMPHSLRLLNVERSIVKAQHTPNQVLDIIDEVLA
jgi:TusA-related sulfurtransferase